MAFATCPMCKRTKEVPEYAVGKTVRCKKCNIHFLVNPPETNAEDSDSVASARPKWFNHPLWQDQAPPVREGKADGLPAHDRSHGDTTTPEAGQQKPPDLRGEALTVPAAKIVIDFAAARAAPAGLPVGKPSVLSPRTRRLLADADQMRRALSHFPLIQIRSTSGDPPELYLIEYHVQSLARGAGGKPVRRGHHLVEIQLTRDYPRQSPKCKMLTPIFHPNFDPTTICVGDHWAASERLVDLVIRIGEMIAFQAYNLKSPLDGEAAMWADLNQQALPTDSRDLRPPNLE